MHTSGCRFHIAGRTRILKPESLDGTWDLVSGRHGPMLDTRISRLVQGLSIVERPAIPMVTCFTLFLQLTSQYQL